MLKYILYFIWYIVCSFAYFITVAVIAQNSNFRGLDGDTIDIIYIQLLIFGPIIVGFFYTIRKVAFLVEKDNTTYIKSWTLLDFSKENSAIMQVGEFQRFLGKSYHKCIFTKENDSKIFVRFSKQLGELTAAEISEKEPTLRIGLSVSKKYYLYAITNKVEAWEQVELK